MPIQIAALGAEGVSELIALGGLALGAGAAASGLSSERVEISTISVGIAGDARMHVGDSFSISASFSVSYGQVYSGGGLTIKLYEVGNAQALASRRLTNRASPKEQITINFQAKAIKDGTKRYYVRVEATGEDDVPWWPVDKTVTRVQDSPHVALTVDPPVVLRAEPRDQSVGHGATARAQMLATNRSEERALTSWALDGGYKYAWLPGNSGPTVVETRDKAHGATHPLHINPMQYYFAPNRLIDPVMVMITGRGVLTYRQASERLLDLRVNCTRAAARDRRVGYLPDSFRPRRPGTSETRLAFACVDEDGTRIACLGVLQDAWGNRKAFRSTAAGRVRVRAAMAGSTATLTLVPRDPDLAPQTVTLPVSMLTPDIERIEFALRRGPDIQGRILVDDETTPVPAARIALVADEERIVTETTSDDEGDFSLATRQRDFRGPLLLRVDLPDNPTYAWRRRRIEYPLLREEIEEMPRITLRPRVRPGEETVALSGRAYTQDGLSGEAVPVPDLAIVLRDEAGAEVARAVADGAGKYALEAPAGRYIVRREPPAELGFGLPPDAAVTLRSSRRGLDVRVKRPAPRIEAARNGEILGSTGIGGVEAEVVAVYEGAAVKRAAADARGCFAMKLTGLRGKKGVRFALAVGGVNGPLSAPLDF